MIQITSPANFPIRQTATTQPQELFKINQLAHNEQDSFYLKNLIGNGALDPTSFGLSLPVKLTAYRVNHGGREKILIAANQNGKIFIYDGINVYNPKGNAEFRRIFLAYMTATKALPENKVRLEKLNAQLKILKLEFAATQNPETKKNISKLEDEIDGFADLNNYEQATNRKYAGDITYIDKIQISFSSN